MAKTAKKGFSLGTPLLVCKADEPKKAENSSETKEKAKGSIKLVKSNVPESKTEDTAPSVTNFKFFVARTATLTLPVQGKSKAQAKKNTENKKVWTSFLGLAFQVQSVSNG